MEHRAVCARGRLQAPEHRDRRRQALAHALSAAPEGLNRLPPDGWPKRTNGYVNITKNTLHTIAPAAPRPLRVQTAEHGNLSLRTDSGRSRCRFCGRLNRERGETSEDAQVGRWHHCLGAAFPGRRVTCLL